MSLNVIILAAGAGTRMHSSIPKVLHEIAGKPMLQHVIETAESLQPKNIHVIYGHEGERVKATLNRSDVHWIEQAERLGTGHALKQALPLLDKADHILVLSADVPLISTASLQALQETTKGTSLGLVVAEFSDPKGLGRIIRKENKIIGIVEERDASEAQKQINEIYSGIMLTSADNLSAWLPKLSNNNAQGEYYLTEVIAMACNEGKAVNSVRASEVEVSGVNNRVQLAKSERNYQQQQAEKLMLQGVTIKDPQRFDLRGELIAGQDVVIDINVIIEGKVTLGNGTYVGPNSIIRDSQIAENARIEANSIIEQAIVAADCVIGPYARIRPGTELAAKAKVGNFVEVKKSYIGAGSKANHLSYIGDTKIGRNVNVGAGTITCNYDGHAKHQTVIEDDVFIGSDTQLVAPVTIGRGATIGAGSTIRKDAPPGELTVSPLSQKTIPGWKRPKDRD